MPKLQKNHHQSSCGEVGREIGRELKAKIISGGKATGRSADATNGQQWNKRPVMWCPTFQKGFLFWSGGRSNKDTIPADPEIRGVRVGGYSESSGSYPQAILPHSPQGHW